MSEAVELQEAHALFERIRSQSADAPGVTRISYGDGENFAHAQIAQWAHALTLEVEHDAAGNQYVTLPGRDRSQPKVIMGSHMDSVRHGGTSTARLASLARWRLCIVSCALDASRSETLL